MLFLSQRESRFWSAAGLCLLLIYLSAFFARPLANYLRDRNLLRGAVLAVFLVAVGVVVCRLRAVRPGWRAWVASGIVASVYLLLLVAVPMLPEERLHFLEYGLVAVLVYEALRERREVGAMQSVGSRRGWGRTSPSLLAVALTGLAGWLDEGIQALLPDRYYDLRDVAFNTVAAVLAVGSVKWIESVRQANSAARQT